MTWFQRMMLGFCVLMDEATDGTQGTGGGTATADPPQGGGGGTQTQSQNQPANTGFTADQLQSVTTAITQAVQEQVQTLADNQARLQAEVEQLSKPRTNGSQMFGAPGIRQGEDPMSSRGFQTARAMMMVKGELEPENCKVETDLSQKLVDFYCKQGFARAAQNSVFIPMASSEIAMNDTGLATEVRQCMAAGVQGADIGMAAHMAQQMGYERDRVNQSLSVYDDTAGGIWTRSDISTEFLPLIRNMEVMSRLGARTLTLPPNGAFNMGSQTSSTVGYWVGEKGTITGSTFGTGLKSMRAKKCAALVTYPNEFVRFASASVEAFIRADVALTLALLIDDAALQGVGSDLKPKGIINYSGIQTHTAGTVATDGNTFEPEDPNMMLGKLEDSNFDIDRLGPKWLMRGTMWRNMLNRRAGSGYAADDGKGAWLFQANRDDISKGAPSMLNGHQVVRSSQVSNERTKGSGTDLTYILLGIWQNLIIGRHGVLEVATADQNGNNFETDQRSIRFIQHVDTSVTYEESFVMCDSINMDLPGY
ncbi:phage major capsid protein [Gimesia fumaroli]|uniref:Phage capsid family protein n=1 Tax=Gimesia fumaroli TaxID=2527976 RepID=A0A518I8W7_9PLAN|nr:phage major capsid protein [Gimesia fumaroli]QDV49540.1 Phage capsid family protein [Gimesia fumaroli]